MRFYEIKLTKHQSDLLAHLLAATSAVPTASGFHCGRLMRDPFAWIIHPSSEYGVRVTHWDDVLALQGFGLIELQLTHDDPDVCTFVLTERACQVHERYQCMALPTLETGYNEASPV